MAVSPAAAPVSDSDLTLAKVYATAENTDKRLSFEGELEFDAARQPLETEVAIFVNPNKKFQTFLGIGGAITDASAEVFSQMSQANQDALLEAYFGEHGIGWGSVIPVSVVVAGSTSAVVTDLEARRSGRPPTRSEREREREASSPDPTRAGASSQDRAASRHRASR